jgi:hypothetical protein
MINQVTFAHIAIAEDGGFGGQDCFVQGEPDYSNMVETWSSEAPVLAEGQLYWPMPYSLRNYSSELGDLYGLNDEELTPEEFLEHHGLQPEWIPYSSGKSLDFHKEYEAAKAAVLAEFKARHGRPSEAYYEQYAGKIGRLFRSVELEENDRDEKYPAVVYGGSHTYTEDSARRDSAAEWWSVHRKAIVAEIESRCSEGNPYCDGCLH